MAHAQMTRAPATRDDVSVEEKAVQPAPEGASLAEGQVPGETETARTLTAETALTVYTNA